MTSGNFAQLGISSAGMPGIGQSNWSLDYLNGALFNVDGNNVKYVVKTHGTTAYVYDVPTNTVHSLTVAQIQTAWAALGIAGSGIDTWAAFDACFPVAGTPYVLFTVSNPHSGPGSWYNKLGILYQISNTGTWVAVGGFYYTHVSISGHDLTNLSNVTTVPGAGTFFVGSEASNGARAIVALLQLPTSSNITGGDAQWEALFTDITPAYGNYFLNDGAAAPFNAPRPCVVGNGSEWIMLVHFNKSCLDANHAAGGFKNAYLDGLRTTYPTGVIVGYSSLDGNLGALNASFTPSWPPADVQKHLDGSADASTGNALNAADYAGFSAQFIGGSWYLFAARLFNGATDNSPSGCYVKFYGYTFNTANNTAAQVWELEGNVYNPLDGGDTGTPQVVWHGNYGISLLPYMDGANILGGLALQSGAYTYNLVAISGAPPSPPPPPPPPPPIQSVRRTRAWTYSLDGHTFYVIDLGAEGTFVYDTVTAQWAKFETAGYQQAYANTPSWNMHVGCMWGNRVVAGDIATGDVWELVPSAVKDQGTIDIVHVVTGALNTRSRTFHSVDSLRVQGSVGQLDDVAGVNMSLRFSDDQGETWSPYFSAVLNEADFDNEIAFRSLGAFCAPGRIFELSDSGGLVRIDGCDAFIDNFDEDMPTAQQPAEGPQQANNPYDKLIGR